MISILFKKLYYKIKMEHKIWIYLDLHLFSFIHNIDSLQYRFSFLFHYNKLNIPENFLCITKTE